MEGKTIKTLAEYITKLHQDDAEFFKEYEALGTYWQKRLDLPSRYRMLNRLIRNSIKQSLRKSG